MRRSVFSRYITAFMLIIFVSFTILTLIICSNMSMLTMSNKEDVVHRSSESVAHMFSETFNPSSADEFSSILAAADNRFPSYVEHLSDFSDNLNIMIFDMNGNSLATEENSIATVFKSAPGAALSEKLKESGTLSGNDNLGGMLNGSYLYNCVPIMASDGSTPVGMVFACSSTQSVNTLIVSTIKTMVMASLWVFLAALIAVYFISERIIGPLKEMSRAAKCYASGKFDVRIPVHGDDEVAELSAAFNQMASSLESLENMRSSFLASVSHDLKTPMTVISGFIDGILSGAIPPENQTEYLERIKNEVLRLSRLVRQLLDLSRIQAGDRKFEFTTFDICEVARQIVLSFEQKIDEKQLDVEFECEQDRMKVYADKDSIHQILYNICDNAVKFARPGGKYKIELSYRKQKVLVSVYNEGQGIAKEDLPFVFERFYKSDKSRGLDKTGVGLGLYISKTIIDAHGETIRVDSEAGQWCKFEFTLQKAMEEKTSKELKESKE